MSSFDRRENIHEAFEERRLELVHIQEEMATWHLEQNIGRKHRPEFPSKLQHLFHQLTNIIRSSSIHRVSSPNWLFHHHGVFFRLLPPTPSRVIGFRLFRFCTSRSHHTHHRIHHLHHHLHHLQASAFLPAVCHIQSRRTLLLPDFAHMKHCSIRSSQQFNNTTQLSSAQAISPPAKPIQRCRQLNAGHFGLLPCHHGHTSKNRASLRTSFLENVCLDRPPTEMRFCCYQ